MTREEWAAETWRGIAAEGTVDAFQMWGYCRTRMQTLPSKIDMNSDGQNCRYRKIEIVLFQKG